MEANTKHKEKWLINGLAANHCNNSHVFCISIFFGYGNKISSFYGHNCSLISNKTIF